MILQSQHKKLLPYLPLQFQLKNDTVICSGDIIVWKYKNINGKLYKRKYNQTTQKWIGNWIPA